MVILLLQSLFFLTLLVKDQTIYQRETVLFHFLYLTKFSSALMDLP